jgi:hypothetical protein
MRVRASGTSSAALWTKCELVFLPGLAAPLQFPRTPRKPDHAAAMDSAELRPETAASHPAPQFHIAPRDPAPGDTTPAFFARFDAAGRTLELLTPTTHECYIAATVPVPSAC